MSFARPASLLLALLPGMPTGAPAEEIVLRAPVDWQVVQRATATAGTAVLAGTAPEGGALEWRLAGAAGGAWRPVPAAAGGEFRAPVSLPAGGWHRLELRATRAGEVIAEARVEHLGVGEVFLVAGQSNSANYGSGRQRPRTGQVAAFDGKSWRVADDPQPGAGGDGGSFQPAFGDAIAARFGVPVGIVAVGQGATSVREWLPGGTPVARLTTTGQGLREIAPGRWESDGHLFGRLAQRLDALGPRGVRAVLWHQGESDAGQARAGYPADRQISGDDYFAYLATLIRAAGARAGGPLPWFTAQTTYHSEGDPADEEFRAAQKRIWDAGLARPGPDTDALRAEWRDGVHFHAKGLQKHGELWAEKVGPWLAEQLAKPGE